jgi:PD-(D/E)XK endonuclease
VETNTKGNVTEATVLQALVALGLHVLVPFGGGHPYDLVVHLPTGAFLRIQCKTAREVGGCAQFNSRSTDHGRGRLSYVGRADLFAAYFPPTRAIYLVPVSEADLCFVSLRLVPTRNNQRRGVRLAADYEIASWSVERLCRLAEPSPNERCMFCIAA